MQARFSTEEIFRQLADVLTQSGYPDFLPTLVQRIAHLLDVEFCLIADATLISFSYLSKNCCIKQIGA